EFNETLAPEKSTNFTLGSSLLFQARDNGHPLPFIKPSWAHTYPTEKDIIRSHGSFEYGYWWIEWGGTLNVIKDDDIIREELLKILFGVWDHIKNQGNHGADNWALDWFGFLPARRESRRLTGAYVLREDDLTTGRVFPDEVAYGGWPIDHHFPKGFHHNEKKFWFSHKLKNIYSIPLRSLYSAKIKNLFFGGRAISATHLAFCSTRVMATCAVMGQGAGTAAAYCIKKRLIPENLSAENIREIKQTILKQDGYLIGTANNDPDDFAQKASISAGSTQKGFEAENVIDGITRTVGNSSHQWRSASLNTADAYIELDFKVTRHLSELHLTFDTNFSRIMTLSHQNYYNKKMIPGPQPETVKDYNVEADNGSGWKTVLEVKNN
ncbi:FAD-dependent oxidoreductase, partial [bacterium]|nr:FAD-dependent oxidoreductase [bacterium]